MSDKEKDKLEKRKAKEAKAKAKLEKRLAKIAEKQKHSGKVTTQKTTASDWTDEKKEETQEAPQEESWWSKFKEKHQFKKNLYDKKDLKAAKDKKDKTNYKLAFKEFPVKMVKEVSKIKWASKRDLTYKFIQVVIFMVISAAFFYLIDWIFKLIFTAIKVI